MEVGVGNDVLKHHLVSILPKGPNDERKKNAPRGGRFMLNTAQAVGLQPTL